MLGMKYYAELTAEQAQQAIGTSTSAIDSLEGFVTVVSEKKDDGSEVITEDEVIVQKVGKVDVVDTVGAGDSFTAAFIVSYLNGESFETAQKKASETAAYVCAHKGAMPE